MMRYSPSRRDTFGFFLGAGTTAIIGIGIAAGVGKLNSNAVAMTADFKGPITVEGTSIEGQAIALRSLTVRQIRDLQDQLLLRSEHKINARNPYQE